MAFAREAGDAVPVRTPYSAWAVTTVPEIHLSMVEDAAPTPGPACGPLGMARFQVSTEWPCSSASSAATSPAFRPGIAACASAASRMRAAAFAWPVLAPGTEGRPAFPAASRPGAYAHFSVTPRPWPDGVSSTSHGRLRHAHGTRDTQPPGSSSFTSWPQLPPRPGLTPHAARRFCPSWPSNEDRASATCSQAIPVWSANGMPWNTIRSGVGQRSRRSLRQGFSGVLAMAATSAARSRTPADHQAAMVKPCTIPSPSPGPGPRLRDGWASM